MSERPTDRLLRWLAGRLVRGPDAEHVLGDLDEVRARDLERGVGPARARLRYLSNTLRSAVALRRRARRERRTRRGGRGAGGISLLDLKLGLRMLVKYPGLTLIGGISISFAVAVGTASFELARDALYPTLSIEDGDRVVRIHQVNRRDAGDRLSVTLDDLRHWRENVRAVEQIGGLVGTRRTLHGEGTPTAPLDGVVISPAAFRIARVQPLLGRGLVAADEAPGASPVAVLSEAVWASRFGRDPGVVGRAVGLGAEQVEIVGVMPASFDFPVEVDLWLPLVASPGALATQGTPRNPEVVVFGRLAEGASLESAQAELSAVGVVSSRDAPDHLRGVPLLQPFAEPAVVQGAIGRSAALLLGAAFLVGLVVLACANVALLVFARTATREREIAIRNALGASRRRIVHQLFAESAVLAVVATALGLAAGSWGLGWVVGVLDAQGEGLPPWFDESLSLPTLGWALVLGLVATVVAGVAPALEATGSDVHGTLQRVGGRGSASPVSPVWSAILVTQVALTVVFVPMVVALAAYTWEIRTWDLGVPAEEYLTAEVRIDGRGVVPGGPDPGSAEPDRLGAALAELTRRLEAEPEVRAVTFSSRVPGEPHPAWSVDVEGPLAEPDAVLGFRPHLAHVAPDFFEAMGVEVLAGRGIDAGDVRDGPGVVVVNRSFEAALLGGRSAVGRRVRFPREAADGDPESAPWHEIVGVVEDITLTASPELRTRAGVYRPLRTAGADRVKLTVHVPGGPGDFTPRLRELAGRVDPALGLHHVRRLTESYADTRSSYVTWFKVVVVAGGLALLLTNAGIYAILAYTVSRRTREIGVRVALGAARRRIVGAVLARSLTRVGLGIALGGVAIWLATRRRWAELELGLHIEPGPLVAYLGFMILVCMSACVVPTRRALAVEPTEALKGE